ncbi:VOC family protein [Croceimicrobium sp.]|uniref:VOC family protein n=1 Tax=Croceimicrobium sp. TaxID=2828340 RepID=UPI003BA98298
MKFAYTILYVPNVQESLHFYQKAFGFEIKFVSPQGDYGELICGDTTLSFACNELGEANFKQGFQKADGQSKPWGVELAFSSEQVEEDFQKALDAGATLYEGIKEKPWGQKVGYLRDLNGFLIEMCSPIAD